MRARVLLSTRFLASLLTVCLGVGPTSAWAGRPVAVRAPASPGEEDEAMVAAQAAYQDGERAYRLGDFETAAGHFERAYELSALPDILYNIGLSHLRWYDTDPDVAHLRKAKVVLQNYLIEVQKDPALGDADEAETLIAQIDEKISASGEGEGEGAGMAAPSEPGPDPGRKLRLGGAVAMGVGGAFMVGGAVGGALMGLKGIESQNDLAAAFDRELELGCTPDNTSSTCTTLYQNIDTLRRNGRTANALAVSLAVGLGGLGVVGLVTGAVLFVQGKKKTKRWNVGRAALVPSFGPQGGSLTLTGQF